MPGRLRGVERWQGAAVAWTLVLVLWLAAATGHAANAWIERAAVLVAFAVLALWLGGRMRRLWSEGGAEGRILLLLVAASFAVHFFGLGHDVAHGYFRDEGTYRKMAREINQGLLLRAWFIYPHLLFYLDAIAFWAASLFEPLVSFWARVAYGVEDPHHVQLLVGRHVTATLGALTVLPVFALARRLGGTSAAALGGALVVLSPLYVRTAHLNISDVAAAFFATLALAAAADLLDGGRKRAWAWAGLWAGLAAGSKYPAGVVAVSIVAVALRWSLERRRLPAGLAVSGLVALAAFLAATPSLLAFPEAVFRGGGADILFGVRQYSGSGWTGVVHQSNTVYYLGLLRESLGLPALALGLLGLALAPPPARRRLLWLLPFPALYLALVLRMSVAVERNLLPVLPALCAFAGAGIAAILVRGARRWPLRRRLAVAAGVVICLAGPAYRTAGQSISLARASTREVAAAWVRAHLPAGSVFLAEFYTPDLGSRWRYPTWRERFAPRFTRDELRDPRHDFLFLASDAYLRFLEPGSLVRAPWDDAMADRYREIFETYPLVREFRPARWQAGPVLELYRLDPEIPTFFDRRSFAAAEALVSHRRMSERQDGAIVHRRPEQWSLFKAFLAAGRYRVAIDADLAAGRGRLRVVNRANEEVDQGEIAAGERLEVDLPSDDKYFLYVHLPAGSRLRGVTLEREQRRSE